MELFGVLLGITVALLWGSSDSISAFAVRRIGALSTTLFSQSTGLLILAGLSALFLPIWTTFTPLTVLVGAMAGLFGSVGYLTFYRGLAIGPISLVSAISSSNAMITLILALLFLHDQITAVQGIALGIIVLGIVLTALEPGQIRHLFSFSKKQGGSLINKGGIRWALLATLAFGCMDFFLGLSARVSNWLLPILFMRLTSLLILSMVTLWTRRQHSVRSMNTPEQPATEHAKSEDAAILRQIRKFQADRLAELSNNESTITLSPQRQQELLRARLANDTTIILRPSPARSIASRTRRRATGQTTASPSARSEQQTLSPGFISFIPTRSLSGFLRNPQDPSISQATTILLPPLSPIATRSAKLGGILIAMAGSVLENMAVLLFSWTTQIATTSITAVLASNYSVISVLVGLIAFREKLALSQFIGIGSILGGVALLTFRAA